MSCIKYRSGSWIAIARSSTLVVLPAGTSPAMIDSIWTALAEGPDIEKTLRSVTAGFGSDPTGMPGFAIAVLGAPLHVIIRGRLRLTCQGADPQEISGAHVTTWSEQVLFNQDAFELTMDEEPGGEADLPLLGGVVLTSGLSVRIDGDKSDEVGKSIDAAGPVDAEPPVEAQQEQEPEAEPEPEPEQEPEPEPEPERVNLAEGHPTLRPEEPAADSSTESAPGASTALIDSVPWTKRSPQTDHDGHTVMSSELREDPEPSVEDADHDGHTVMRSSLTPPQPDKASEADNRIASRPATGPVVLGRMCPQEHANPPTNSHCCICGSPISSEPGQMRRPSLGRMRISTGEVIELDRSVIVGRQPSASRVAGNGMPRLVQVKSADGDISRSHLEVQLEGWHVMLRDLHSTNGTFLTRPGQSPRRLVPGEQTMLLDGDTVEIGDEVSIQFEDLQ
ncbi:FHA domain-containing protein [Arthrobacter monumenti]